jgi:iron complex outermembrane receptor protein
MEFNIMRQALLLGAAFAALFPAIAQAQDTSPDQPQANASDKDQPAPRSNRRSDRGDIIITASPFAASGDDTPTIAAKVDRKQILEAGGASLADSLASVPGISATGFAAGASRPIIRGMDATRVRVLEDGVSSSDVSDIGPDHGMPIDPLSAQSIEVVRGAATLRYGSQAIGGVVNAINNRVPTFLPTQNFSGEVNGSFSTVANTGEGSALADVKAGDFVLHADGFVREAENYDTPLGTQTNSFFHGYGGSLGGSYFFGPDSKSRIGLAVTQYDAKYGIPSDTTYIDMRQTKILGRASFDLGSGVLQTLNIDTSYANYKHDEDDPDGTIEATFKNKELDGRAELLLGPLGPLSNTAIGVEVQRRKFQALGADRSYLFPTTTQSEAAFLFTELPLTSTLKLQGSGRVEHVYADGTPASNVFTETNFTPVSGAIGALYSPNSVFKFGLTFSSTGRAPAITELFARGGHDGPDTFETGDPNLKIERANSLEGSVRVNTGRFTFEGSVYSTWFNNYIYGNLTGRTCDDDGVCSFSPDGDLKELNYLQQGAHFRGLEGVATYQVVKTDSGSLEVKAQGDYVRATLDDGSNVPRIPPYRFGGGLSWTSKTFDAGFLFLHSARQDDFGAFDTATPSFNSLNAQVALRPFRDHPGIELAVVGQNLTNDIQRDAAALNKDVVVMPGRNIRFVLRLATF